MRTRYTGLTGVTPHLSTPLYRHHATPLHHDIALLDRSPRALPDRHQPRDIAALRSLGLGACFDGTNATTLFLCMAQCSSFTFSASSCKSSRNLSESTRGEMHECYNWLLLGISRSPIIESFPDKLFRRRALLLLPFFPHRLINVIHA